MLVYQIKKNKDGKYYFDIAQNDKVILTSGTKDTFKEIVDLISLIINSECKTVDLSVAVPSTTVSTIVKG